MSTRFHAWKDRGEHGRERIAGERAQSTTRRKTWRRSRAKARDQQSRKSIANFKLRENVPIGCRVTLRRDAMYEFFDRLVAVTLPRIRDFRGTSPRSFDEAWKLFAGHRRPDGVPGNRTGQD